jgi:hypothetical protein
MFVLIVAFFLLLLAVGFILGKITFRDTLTYALVIFAFSIFFYFLLRYVG